MAKFHVELSQTAFIKFWRFYYLNQYWEKKKKEPILQIVSMIIHIQKF